MVSLIMGTTCLTKVLMDEGSDLNMLYANTLNKMGIPWSSLCPRMALFYRIVLGWKLCPLGASGSTSPLSSRTTSTRSPSPSRSVDYLGVYHALHCRLCFAKFMAVPNHTYLNLKMPGLKGVITIEGSFE
ncbi:uncharacterized protein [Miscanthus floridulus]|uniref:uncharacterized protein n=1 Tax=Miscanthus floridulus TaxID=154761 RepID=UPI00345AB0D9